MRKRTRSNGPQPKCIRIRIGSKVYDILLTSASKLPDRCKTIAYVTTLSDDAKRMLDLSSNQPQSHENADIELDTQADPVSIEELELTNIFEFSTEREDFFSFQ
jgi:hypothetical protein